MKTVALFNLKGGVGKTSAAVNLAVAAARGGERTVIWDLDAQGAATWLLAARESEISMKKILADEQRVARTIRHSPFPRLDVIPAAFTHRKLDALLADRGSKAFKKIVAALARRYDRLVIDAPPSLARLADNIFRVSDLVVVPVIPAPLALRAYEQVRSYLDGRKRRPEVRAFLSMVDRRRKHHAQWLQEPPASLEGVLLQTMIPYAASVERMSVDGIPLLAATPNDPVARRYQALHDEISALL